MSMDPSNPNPYGPPMNYGAVPPKPDSGELTTVDWLLCIFCSTIGCIVGIVRLVQGKANAGKMIGISVLFAILWTIVRFAVTVGLNNQ